MPPTAADTPQRAPEARVIHEIRGGLGDLKRLAVMELALARAEGMAALKRLAIALGLVGAALLFLYAAFIYAVATVAYVLGAFDHWWGVLATAGALVLIAALLAFVAIRLVLRAKRDAMSTFQSIKGDLEWLRQLAVQRSSES